MIAPLDHELTTTAPPAAVSFLICYTEITTAGGLAKEFAPYLQQQGGHMILGRVQICL